MTEVITTSSIKLKAIEDNPKAAVAYLKTLYAGDSEKHKQLYFELVDFIGEIVRDHGVSQDEPKLKQVVTEAVKNDQGKPQYHLLPNDVLQSVGAVLAFGASAEKYEAHNWRKGMAWSRMFDAAQRHIWAFWEGEDNDPESGLPHLAHAVTCLMFLCSYHLSETGEDDRFVAPNNPLDLSPYITKEVIESWVKSRKEEGKGDNGE